MTADKNPVRRALGRGLDALLPVPSTAKPSPAYGSESVFLCAIEKIVPQKGQPRQYFDAAALEELAQSIQEHGLLEPLVVRRAGTSDRFELIAGERRWRASQKAGLREVLVVVKDVSPDTAFELALIENVQREDLNPIELAEALGRLVEEHGYTQEVLSKRLGKDRTTIANTLRLLKLPATIRERVVTGELSEGHARAILSAGEAMEDVANRVVSGKLSVRQTEELARRLKAGKGSGGKGANGSTPTKAASVRDLEARLSRALGAKVEVRDRGNKGEIAIQYGDLDALDRIIDKLV